MDQEQQAEICARIKLAREEAGMTLEEMADALDVTERAYWNYENNRVPFRRMAEIAAITGKSQDWLYRGEQSVEPSDPALLQDVAKGIAELERSSEHVLRQLDDALARLERIEDALSPPGETQRRS